MKSSNYKVSVLSLEQLLTGCGEAVLRPAGKAPTVEEHGLSSMPGTSPAGPSMDFDRAEHCVDHAAELDDAAVAGALDDAAAMDGDRGVDQIASQRPEPRERAILIGAGKPAVSDDVGDQDRDKLAVSLIPPATPLCAVRRTRTAVPACVSKAI